MKTDFKVIEGGRYLSSPQAGDAEKRSLLRARLLRICAYLAMALTLAFLIEHSRFFLLAKGGLTTAQLICLTAAIAGFALLAIGSLRWLRAAPARADFEKQTKERTL